MDQTNLDAMFEDMLGELDIISQQLEEKSDRNDGPNSSLPQNRASTSSHSSTGAGAAEPEDDFDLNAMLSDLTDWEQTLTPAPQVHVTDDGGIDERYGSGVGFSAGSVSQDSTNKLVSGLDVSPQFNTLKRSMTDGPSVTFDDDQELSLASLEKDIESENRKKDKSRQLSSEEMAALSPEVREERMRAEKMRIALEKLKEARIQKLVVKVFNKDDSSKTLMVDERMTTRSVIKQLLEKNHYEASVNWALVEELPSLYMERIFEEHESVTEMLSYWTRDTTNQVRFLERKDKYALFRNPQHYLLSVSDTEGQMAERQKQTLIEEFFSGRSGSGVPEVQGILYIKGESKSWGRKYCVLRNSGLYCSKSGEPKKGKKVSDLQCLVMFEQVCVYLGRGWKKKHKSPTDYGFALKHPAIQTKSKHIRYFCCDDVRSLMRWIVGIRCAKYGKQLKDNFDRTNMEMKGAGDGHTLAYHVTQSDASSNDIGDSAESDKPAFPQSSITNVFGGAWQRANQQENIEGHVESSSGVQRGKSVWKPGQPKTNSNWWDLGASPELEELAGSTQIPDAGISKSGNRSGDSQIDDLSPEVVSAGHYAGTAGYQAPKVPLPPKPAKKPPATASTPQPTNISSARRPVVPNRKMPPPPPPELKPVAKTSSPPPPPPSMYDLPPPPPLGDMPPPPPLDDLPPPPDDDMPLPPPMELSPNPGLPKGLQGMEGQPPVRLPFLPMFKNSGPTVNLRHASPGTRGGPPVGNFNSSNNKAPAPRPGGQHSHAGQKPFDTYNRGGFHPPKSCREPPLAEYYSSKGGSGESPVYCKSALPPPPDFVYDLKDTFHHALGRDSDSSFDLPPPPPELLLQEVRSRSFFGAPKATKPAPPPPRRSPSTKLSFKRK